MGRLSSYFFILYPLYDSWFVVTACHEALAGWKDLHFYPPPMRRLVIPRKRSFQDSFAAQFNWKLWMVSDFYFFRVDIIIFNSKMSFYGSFRTFLLEFGNEQKKKLVAEFEHISLSCGLISNQIKCPHHSCATSSKNVVPESNMMFSIVSCMSSLLTLKLKI